MEKRDPLKEVGNTSDNNEIQEETKDRKVPQVVDSSEKENGGVMVANTDPEKAGCGKLRLSFLKAFDPLYSESPGKSDASLQPEKKRPQLIIEDSDFEPSQSSPIPLDVSDDDAAFVDATYIATSDDETNGQREISKAKRVLDESLLKFYTPNKFNTTLPSPTAESTSKSPVKESVLSENKEPVSTSVVNQPVEEKDLSVSAEQKVHSTTGDVNESKFASAEVSNDESETQGETSAEQVQSEPDSKEQDSAGSETEGNITGNISDSTYSEVSDIKTDSPDKSKENSENELIETGEYSGAQGAKSDNPPCPEPADTPETAASSDDNRETSESLLSKTSDSSEKDAKRPAPVAEGNAGRSQNVQQVQHRNVPVPEADSDSEEYAVSLVEHLVNGIYTSESFSTSDERRSESANRNSGVAGANPEETLEQKLRAEDREGGKGDGYKVEEQETSDTVSSFQSDDESIKENLRLLEKETAEKGFEEGQKAEENAKEIFDSYIDDSAESTIKVEPTISSPQKKEQPLDLVVPQEPVIEATKPVTDVVASEVNKEEENLGATVETRKSVEESLEEHLDSPEKESPKPVLEDSKSSTKEDSEVNEEEQYLSARVETRRSIEQSPEPTEGNTTIPVHQDEEQHLDSGVDSIEESYTKSPKSSVDELEGGNVSESKEDLADNEVLEERKVEPDSHLTSDDDSKTISEGSAQSEKTVTETNSSDEPESFKSEKIIEQVEVKPEDTSKDSTVANNTAFDAGFYKAKMADLSERLSEQQQENSDLKLQLNASQQAKASLELEIRQKEEVIIKTQAEALKNEQVYKQEIKQLREKLKENSKLIEKDGSKEMEEQLKEAKAREAKAIAELNQRNKDDLNYQKIMEEYENTIATRLADYQKLKEEHETATRHLANIELAFSDVHQKYERTKALLESFKSNEEGLSQSLQASEKTCKQHEDRYESLKAHAKAQLEISNKEILTLREKYEMDTNKLRAIIKRLEIKCSSLEVSLQQKTEECDALSALCDEVTGKKV